MEGLKNKVAVITGSSAGIGESTAVMFARLGCHVTLTGRDVDRLKSVTQRCVQAGCPQDKVVTVTGDLRDKTVQQEILDKTLNTFGRLDILVNNAGIYHTGRPLETTEEEYDTIMGMNTKVAFLLSKLLAPELIKTKGTIVNVSSQLSTRPAVGSSVHCMSKAALDMFTQCLALDTGKPFGLTELAPHGVRVNSVNPGVVDTMILRRGPQPLTDEQYAETLQKLGKLHPLGGVAQAEDVANSIVYLASDMSRFITGTIVFVDGGRHCGTVNSL